MNPAPMTDRNPTDLDPALQPIAAKVMMAGNAAIAPSKVAITVTWRSPSDQQAAKAAGLSKAGAGQSPHNCTLADGTPAARAFDFAIFDENGAYVTDGRDSRYAAVGQIAVAAELEWAGNWTLEKDGCEPDYDHCQMANWRSA
jgi:hypothetical protein